MARKLGPDAAERVFYVTATGADKGKIFPTGTAVPLYADALGTLPADVLTQAGGAMATVGGIPTTYIDATLQVPLFQFPDTVDATVYTSVGGGPIVALHPSTDSRLDALETTVSGAATAASVTAAQAFAIQRVNHTGTQSADTLTDGTTNKAFLATERTKLSGIATGATANSTDATLLARANHTGTQAVATVTGALASASNLSDLANAGTARTNLGLGTAATRAAGPGAGQVLSADTVDAKGDLFVATAADTVTRLPVGTDGQTLQVDSTQASGVRWSTRLFSYGDPLAAGGEAVCDRRLITAPGTVMGSGTLQLTYFTAQVSETVNNLVLYTGGTAAATVTLIRYAVYSVAANGDLTLVASTPNDTSLLAATTTRYLRALSAPWAKVAGVRYAAGLLVVATTTPSMLSMSAQSTSLVDTIFAQEPKLGSGVTGLSDLPSSVVSASALASRRVPYVEMLP